MFRTFDIDGEENTENSIENSVATVRVECFKFQVQLKPRLGAIHIYIGTKYNVKKSARTPQTEQ